jgi:hypothetical protein
MELSSVMLLSCSEAAFRHSSLSCFFAGNALPGGVGCGGVSRFVSGSFALL